MKNLFLTVLLGGLGFMSHSQDYYHGLGGQYSYVAFTSPGDVDVMSTPGIFYKATLGFDTDGPGIGISAYPYIGVFIQDGEGSLGAEFPLMAEVYFGDFDDRNFNIGAGFSASYWYNGWTAGAVIGPKITLGGQFYLRESLLGLRLGYVYGMNRPDLTYPSGGTYKVKKNIIDLGLYYMFGG